MLTHYAVMGKKCEWTYISRMGLARTLVKMVSHGCSQMVLQGVGIDMVKIHSIESDKDTIRVKNDWYDSLSETMGWTETEGSGLHAVSHFRAPLC